MRRIPAWLQRFPLGVGWLLRRYRAFRLERMRRAAREAYDSAARTADLVVQPGGSLLDARVYARTVAAGEGAVLTGCTFEHHIDVVAAPNVLFETCHFLDGLTLAPGAVEVMMMRCYATRKEAA